MENTLEKSALLYCATIIFTSILKSFLPSKEFAEWGGLVKLHPHLQSLRSEEKQNKRSKIVFAILFISMIIILVGVKYDIQIYSIFPLFLAILDVIDGRNSLSNNVFYNGIGSGVSYYYDEKKKYSWISKWQIAFSTVITFVIVLVISQYLYGLYF